VPHAAPSDVADAMPNRASGNVRRNVGSGVLEVPILAHSAVRGAMSEFRAR
jgi:hypothetical protein